MKIEGAISDPPQVFLRKVQSDNDVKGLMNAHRLLHAWMAEVKAGGFNKGFGNNGWTPRWIVPAHDLVVRRLLQLVPSFKHDSPIGAAVAIPPVKPLMIVPEFVSLVGSQVKGGAGPDSDLDVVVKAKDRDESLEVRLAKSLGQDIHVVYDERGSHDEAPFYEPLYHLVLMPVGEWSRVRGDALVAGMSEFKAVVDPVAPLYDEGRCNLGAAYVGALVYKGMSEEEARGVGREAAYWVFSGEPYPEKLVPFSGTGRMMLNSDIGSVVKLYASLATPYEDSIRYLEGEDRVRRRVAELYLGSRGVSRGVLLAAALKIAREEARSLTDG